MTTIATSSTASYQQSLRQQLDAYLARPWLYPDEVKAVKRLASRLGVTLRWESVRVDLWGGQQTTSQEVRI